MRLIDADAFFERMESDTDICAEMEKYGLRALKKYFDMQPTAYDVNKVVEQLEELNKYNLDLADRMLDMQSHGLNRHFICLEDAIEIVKAGGIDE